MSSTRKVRGKKPRVDPTTVVPPGTTKSHEGKQVFVSHPGDNPPLEPPKAAPSSPPVVTHPEEVRPSVEEGQSVVFAFNNPQIREHFQLGMLLCPGFKPIVIANSGETVGLPPGFQVLSAQEALSIFEGSPRCIGIIANGDRPRPLVLLIQAAFRDDFRGCLRIFEVGGRGSPMILQRSSEGGPEWPTG